MFIIHIIYKDLWSLYKRHMYTYSPLRRDVMRSYVSKKDGKSRCITFCEEPTLWGVNKVKSDHSDLYSRYSRPWNSQNKCYRGRRSCSDRVSSTCFPQTTYLPTDSDTPHYYPDSYPEIWVQRRHPKCQMTRILLSKDLNGILFLVEVVNNF